MWFAFQVNSDTCLADAKRALRYGCHVFYVANSLNAMVRYRDLSAHIGKRQDISLWAASQSVGSGPRSPASLRNACIESLRSAGLERWDLYYLDTLHAYDARHDVVSLVREMKRMREDGLIGQVGIRHLSSEQLEALLQLNLKPDAIEIECHLYLQEARLVQLAAKHEILVACLSPMGGGKRQREAILRHHVVKELAAKLKVSPQQLLLSWHVQRGLLTVLCQQDLEVLRVETEQLSKGEMHALSALDCAERVHVRPCHDEALGRWHMLHPLQLPHFYHVKRDAPSYRIWKAYNLWSSGQVHHDNSLSRVDSVRELRQNGFCCIDIKKILGKEFFDACVALRNHVTTESDTVEHFGRSYEMQYKSCGEILGKIKDMKELRAFSELYYGHGVSMIRAFLKTSYPNESLLARQAAMWHRDQQGIEALKAIVYLSDVSNLNGPVRILEASHPLGRTPVRPMRWCWEGSQLRCATQDVRDAYPEIPIHTIAASAYTAIFFDGRALHAGGYVLEGQRDAIYIEISPTKSIGRFSELTRRMLYCLDRCYYANSSF